ncbi:hypothetical protein DLM75_17835 [Leptospira stimsonii]|uniref:Uncharacterized protein n=1 Tax=Leptospira stimsonii TaxID=2202203 RepID=A0A396Z129_9LEPT|nr:hypothetical protein DLM75_17835 [Leptospira stimsonii]
MEEPSGLSFETMMVGFFGKRGTREREEKGVDRQILIEPRLEHLLKIKFSEELGEKIEKENGFQEVFPLKMNFVIFIPASPSYDILLFHHSWKKRIFGYRERKIRFSCKSEQMVPLSLQRFFFFLRSVRSESEQRQCLCTDLPEEKKGFPLKNFQTNSRQLRES